jgi:hypothetical protein
MGNYRNATLQHGEFWGWMLKAISRLGLNTALNCCK